MPKTTPTPLSTAIIQELARHPNMKPKQLAKKLGLKNTQISFVKSHYKEEVAAEMQRLGKTPPVQPAPTPTSSRGFKVTQQVQDRINFIVRNPHMTANRVGAAWGVKPNTVHTFKWMYEAEIQAARAKLLDQPAPKPEPETAMSLAMQEAERQRKAREEAQAPKPEPKPVQDDEPVYAVPAYVLAAATLIQQEVDKLKTGATQTYQVAEQLRCLADVIERRI